MLFISPLLLLAAGAIVALIGFSVFFTGNGLIHASFAADLWTISAVLVVGGAILDALNRMAKLRDPDFRPVDVKRNWQIGAIACVLLIVVVVFGAIVAKVISGGRGNSSEPREVSETIVEDSP